MSNSEPGIGRCEVCVFYKRVSDYGDCRRYAPRPMVVDHSEQHIEGRVLWPTVLEGDGCGDYEPDEEAIAIRKSPRWRAGSEADVVGDP